MQCESFSNTIACAVKVGFAGEGISYGNRSGSRPNPITGIPTAERWVGGETSGSAFQQQMLANDPNRTARGGTNSNLIEARVACFRIATIPGIVDTVGTGMYRTITGSASPHPYSAAGRTYFMGIRRSVGPVSDQ